MAKFNPLEGPQRGVPGLAPVELERVQLLAAQQLSPAERLRWLEQARADMTDWLGKARQVPSEPPPGEEPVRSDP